MLFNAIEWNPGIGINFFSFYTLRYYSLMYLIAFTIGWFIMKRIYKNDSINQEKLDPLLFYTIIGTLLGARLGHVIFYQPELFLQDPLSVFLPVRFKPETEFTGFQGLASHGAAIGIIIAMYFYSKKILHKNILWILDRVVIPVSIGGVFIRLGNFINSEIIGKPTGTDYGVIFTQLGENFPRHPAQLYEAVCYVFVFIILWFVYWKTNKAQKMGYIFGLFLVMLWSIRFFIEFIKEAQVDGREHWLLNTGQMLSIPFIALGFYFIFRKQKK